MFKQFLFLCALSVVVFSCDSDDDNPTPSDDVVTFNVKVENVISSKDFFQSGTTDFLGPNESQSISFYAGVGHRLSFATMFVQSNDLFYAPAETGIELYNNGVAVTGDITSEVDLWDAGTEVNEEPGVGVNQAPRQSGPDTGAEEDGTIQLIENVGDGYTYPTDEDIIRVSLTHDGGTKFTLLIENISNSSTLPSPLAPGIWVVHDEGAQLFEDGGVASEGLEGIAEDGNNTMSAEMAAANTGLVSPFAPGVWAVHAGNLAPIFTDGAADNGDGLEGLAEDGDPAALNDAIASLDVVSNGVFNTPDGASGPGPLLPGGTYSFTIEASAGDYLSLATMLVETNDLFYGFNENGIALFNGDTPIDGDFTAELLLWDAGTEVNEFPGAGAYQPIRGGGDSGPAENGNVRVVDDSFTYPALNETIRLTITPQN